MKRIFTLSIVAALCSLVIVSCTKKDPPVNVGPDPGPIDSNGVGKVKLEFINMAGSSKLVLQNQWFLNEHGDSFTVSRFKYYISNIKLNGTANSYTETDSYHLVEQDSVSSYSFDLANVPYGRYTSVTLMIGVDSLHNVSGAQTGALDPIHDMFWTWNTGYIMLKLEGHSPKSTSAGGILMFHAGGFGGPVTPPAGGFGGGNSYPTQRTVTLSFPSEIVVNGGSENHIHLTADVLKLFKPYVFSFADVSTISENTINSKNLADNYANMLSVTYSGL